MQRTRKQWKEIVDDRLKYVKEAIDNDDHSETIILGLQTEELASHFYVLSCLAVDVWYMFDRRFVYASKRFADVGVIRDPLARLFFVVVVQAISDSRNGRPCDANLWRSDHPPGGGVRCSPAEHICKTYAVEFISDVATTLEPVLHLPAGTFMDLATRKNGSRRSRSNEIFNCTGQEY